MNFLNIDKTSRESIVDSLNEIARNLILSKGLKINNHIFSLVDIEIYYYHELHPDEYANGVDHDRPVGQLEAHGYGIDLSLGNIKDVDFGGILICGLHNGKGNVIQKPHVWITLFNEMNFGNNKIELVDVENPWKEIFRTKRLNLGKAESNNKKEFEKESYKFLAKIPSVFKKYKHKERIIRDSDLNPEERKSILGYYLRS